MPLTRDFAATIHKRARRDPEFRQALLVEGVERPLGGEMDAGRAILRDYLNATLGLQELGARHSGDP